MTGDGDLLVRVRGVLLDALEALAGHRDSVVVIGAQAIYLHTGRAAVGLAESTKDSDLALDVRTLGPDPRLEEAMRAGGFVLDEGRRQPGTWLGDGGVPVDLMVPESLAGPGGRRGARIPPHDPHATRRAAGLEAAVVDHHPMVVRALRPDDRRTYTANVAGPAALLVAKLHKLGDRQGTPHRLVDKDAHDVYRLLVAVPTDRLADGLTRLRADPFARSATEVAVRHLDELFGTGAQAPGCLMAGRAEAGIGAPETVAASTFLLAADLLRTLG